ncbi:52 kDa repressor of the inhibitor of the protein kinase-like [Artemia franciscana]|uniref:HAT C-terminal dimerisation domain-containing protein n=1 Tax=Artemia franciscana TaxID=6661 RepID=A0AA88KV86_ARTSF|nr:hypothetical protein QYM36_018033 [Artemia franciscana]
MALGLRFADSETLHIREEFIEFTIVDDLRSESLGQFILSRIEKLGLDMKLCRGQGYDGAPNMSGHLSGAQAFISSKYPLAKYVHCIAHSLNLVLTDSSKIAEIKHCMMVIRETVNFFHFSAKQSAILKTYTALNLIGLCETRWVKRHDAIQISKQLIVPIFKALEEIETDGDSVTLSKARSLLNNILSLDYIVTLIVMDFFLGYTLNLSKLLQSENIDMVMCIQCVESVTKMFKEIRNSAEGRFHQLFLEATRLCRELEVTLVMLRKRNFFTIPSDIPAEKHIEFYYRVSIFLPFVDQLIQSIESRFTKHKVTLKGLGGILPSFVVKQPSSDLKELIKLYASDLTSSDSTVMAELELWRAKWLKVVPSLFPKIAVQSLAECECGIFPNIYKLLSIFCVIPTSTACVERSFSSIKRIKTYLRSRMSEDRLNGLTLLNVHRDVLVSVDEILEKFAISSPRRLQFKV